MYRNQHSLRERMIGLCAWRPGRLAKGTLAMTAGMGIRTLAQAIVFLIVARVLGVADYGAFSAVMALSTTFACLIGCGTQALMVRDVSRSPDRFAASWGITLATIAASSPILFAVYIASAWVVLPAGVSLYVIVFIGLADLVVAPVGLAAIYAYQGHERIGRAAHLSLMPVLPRLAGALALLLLALIVPEAVRLKAWAVLYAVAAFAAAFYAWRMVKSDLGSPDKPTCLNVLVALREGWPFALGSAATKIYADIDKTMLARLASMEAAGAYSAGYRFADLAIVPVLSLVSAAMPSFFRAGEGGVRATLAYTFRILPLPFAYSILAGLGLYLSAGILPFLLGASYVDAVPTLQWLAWLPVVSLPRILLQTLLIGAGRHNHASNILAGGGVFNITLNLWLIPVWGWRGAVMATYASEITMALTMSIIAFSSQAKYQIRKLKA